MASNAYICLKIECLHLGKDSKKKKSICGTARPDYNAEYTPAKDVRTVVKLVTTFTALKHTTKLLQHRATTNTGLVITIE